MSCFLQSVWLFIYINKRFAIFLFFVYIKTCTLSFEDWSHYYFHIYKKVFFCETFIYTKSKKINPFYVRSIYILKPKYRELSWAIKWNFAFLKKANNSIATKLEVNLLYNCDQFFKKSLQHNSMIKLWYELFKYENERKIGWDN